ncbi:DUF7601 domain-containing protein [Streptococcus hyointestinalis]|uniref:DUF7601 domain-containing protein n=1 Tax=Streptococcus hyointestinalis TaxID=1337 RepID=UPI0013E06835|nr:hypothetical protein [Streptococcus hyointestinalis]
MKMKNSLLKKTTAGLFTAATILTMAAASTTVLADNEIVGAEDKDINVTFGKTLHFSNTVTLPEGKSTTITRADGTTLTSSTDLWFAFQFTAVRSTVCDVNEMPTIGKDKVTVATDGESDKSYKNVVAITDFSGTDSSGKITKSSYDIIDDDDFTKSGRAGEYVYKVSELSNSNFVEHEKTETNDGAGWFKDSMTYDDTEYTMHVFVKNKENDTGCYVSSVYFENGKGEKVDTKELFNNTYLKEAGKNPDANNSKSSLGITKTVTGEYGDKSKEFDFNITLYPPTETAVWTAIKNKVTKESSEWSSLSKDSNGNIVITAYVQNIEEADNVPSESINDGKLTLSNCVAKVTLTKKNADTDEWIATTVEYADSNKSTVNKDETTTDGVPFQLKNGQYLTFVSLPAGFSYTVTEKYSNKYVYDTSAVLFENVNIINGSSLNSDAAIKERLAVNSKWLEKGITEWPTDSSSGMYYTGTTAPRLLQYSEDEETNMGVTIKTNEETNVSTVSFSKIIDGVTTTDKFLIGEHDNSFDVTNNLADTKLPTTGLIVKNLPFIVMIALGVLAFLGLTKKRRAND